MPQAERLILWDTEKQTARKDVWEPVPLPLSRIFKGVHMGDVVTVRIVPCSVVGRGSYAQVRSEAVLNSSASLAYYAEGRFPKPDTPCNFEYNGSTTDNVPFGDLTTERLERELNALSTVVADGGVTVEPVGEAHWQIYFKTIGAASATVAAACLGNGEGFSGDHTVGDVSTHAVQMVYFRSSACGSATTVSGSMTAPSVTVAVVVTGTASLQEVQSVTLGGDFEGGTFTLNDGSSNTVPIDRDASGGSVQQALNDLLGNNTVTVEGRGRGLWHVTWVAKGVQTALTGSAAGLTALQGVSGTLDFSNAADRTAGGPGGGWFMLEATVGTGGTTETLFAEPIELGPWR